MARRAQPAAPRASGITSAPPLTYKVTRLARAISRRLDSMRKEGRLDSLRSERLTGPQVAALLALRSEPGLTGAQLARRAYVTPQSMHEVIQQLEGAGLLRRTVVQAHRRKRAAELTAAGREVLAEWQLAIGDTEQGLLAGFSEGEVAIFHEFLDRCLANAQIGHDGMGDPET